MAPPGSLPVTLLLVASVLAGCLGEENPLPDDPVTEVSDDCSGRNVDCIPANAASRDGRDLRFDLTVEDELPAPKWEIGDVFEVHFYFGKDDSEGSHIQTVVVEDTGSAWVVATTDQEAAKDEATWDFPVMGPISKADLDTSSFGTTWDWMYDFPLSEGKSWTGQVEFLNFNTFGFETHQVTFTAAFDERIDTPHGAYPGFKIEGLTNAGKLLDYNYVPYIQWFSHLWFYDLTTEEEEDFFFHAMSMGVSANFTGEYYLDRGKLVWDSGFTYVPIMALNGEAPYVSGPPAESFTVGEGATYLRGIAGAFVATGVSQLRVVDSEGALMVDLEAQHADGDPEGFGFSFTFVEETPVAGEYRAVSNGAGLVWGAFGTLVEVTEQQFTL